MNAEEPRARANESGGTAAAPRSTAALWLGLLGPPTVWLIQFEINYALTGTGERSRHVPALIATSVIAMAIMLCFGYFAARERRFAAASPLDHMAGLPARNRFMATLGLLSSGLFLLTTIAQFIAEFFFQPGVT